MSIGEDLAAARRRAGLTVTQVSEKTRIREAIIRGIERDDYAACGGDFYARGHIRAIARAIGADPGPMLAEYDAAHRAPPVTAAELFALATPVRVRPRRRPAWRVVLGFAVAAAVAIAAYGVVSGSVHLPHARTAAAPGHRPAAHRQPRGAPSPAAPLSPRPAAPATTPVPRRPYARTVTIRLTAFGDCWVQFTTARGAYSTQLVVPGGTSKRWVFRHAIDMRLGNPRGVRLIVDGKNPLPPGPRPVTLRLGMHGKVSVLAR